MNTAWWDRQGDSAAKLPEAQIDIQRRGWLLPCREAYARACGKRRAGRSVDTYRAFMRAFCRAMPRNAQFVIEGEEEGV